MSDQREPARLPCPAIDGPCPTNCDCSSPVARVDAIYDCDDDVVPERLRTVLGVGLAVGVIGCVLERFYPSIGAAFKDAGAAMIHPEFYEAEHE